MEFYTLTQTVVYDSALEKMWYAFQMDRLTNYGTSDLWLLDQHANFLFVGKFSEFANDLKYFCVLSVEQDASITFESGFDDILENSWPVKITRITIDKFSVIVFYKKTVQTLKEKTKKKIIHRFTSRYPFIHVNLIEDGIVELGVDDDDEGI